LLRRAVQARQPPIPFLAERSLDFGRRYHTA